MMMKYGFLTILISLIPLFGTAQQLKVGVMDPDRVMTALPETEQIQLELQEYNEQMEQIFVGQYSEWIEAVNRFEQEVEAGTLSGAARDEQEQRLIEREEELGNLERRLQMQIQNRQNELINPVMQRVEQALEVAAGEYDLDYVLNRQTSMGDPLIFFASDRAVDITDRVIEILTTN